MSGSFISKEMFVRWKRWKISHTPVTISLGAVYKIFLFILPDANCGWVAVHKIIVAWHRKFIIRLNVCIVCTGSACASSTIITEFFNWWKRRMLLFFCENNVYKNWIIVVQIIGSFHAVSICFSCSSELLTFEWCSITHSSFLTAFFITSVLCSVMDMNGDM